MSQTRNVDLRKEVFNKPQYEQVIDTSFSQLGVTSFSASAENQISVETVTVNDFFESYNDLFYDIPSYGSSNSHEYLVKTSGDYINFDQDNEIIVALRAEISQLRRDLLQAQIATAEALSGEKINLDVDNIQDEDLSGNKEYNDIISSIPTTTNP